MTTVSTSALTPKQKQVADLIGKGVAPAEIAKRLKISTSGVYGHIRNIKAAGVELAVTDAPPAPPVVPVVPEVLLSEPSDPTASLQAAITRGEQRLTQIDAEVASLNTQIGALDTEREAVTANLEKYQVALKALA